jgi:hypothetical protein
MIEINVGTKKYEVDADGVIYQAFKHGPCELDKVRELAADEWLATDYRASLTKEQRKYWQRVKDMPPRHGPS